MSRPGRGRARVEQMLEELSGAGGQMFTGLWRVAGRGQAEMVRRLFRRLSRIKKFNLFPAGRRAW